MCTKKFSSRSRLFPLSNVDSLSSRRVQCLLVSAPTACKELLVGTPFKLNSAESFSLRTCYFQLNEYARRGVRRHLTLVEARVGGLDLLDKEAPVLQVSHVLHQETVVRAVRRQADGEEVVVPLADP